MYTLNLTAADTEKLYMVKAVIEKQYDNHLSHRALAQMVGTNESKLRAGFKQLHNQTIYEFQTSIRIEKAKELLENTSLKAKEVAMKVGYSNPDYFYKIFKKITGKYPSEY